MLHEKKSYKSVHFFTRIQHLCNPVSKTFEFRTQISTQTLKHSLLG